MATTIAKLNIHVGTTTAEVIKGFQSAEGAVNNFARRITGFASTFAGLFGAASVAGIVGWGAKLAADAESAQVAFSVLTGSAEKAKGVLGEMKRLADTTPFEFPEVRAAGQQLLAYGVAADNVVGTMRMLGDVASGMKIPLTELADLFGRNLVQGRLYTKDIREFTGRGIPLVQVLTKELKVNAEQFMQMVENGQIGSKEMVKAFQIMTGEGGMFHDMMEKQSKTLEGRWSSLKDAVKSLALQIGEKLLPTMKQLVEAGFNVVNWLKSLSFETVKNTAKWTVFVGTFVYALTVIPKIVAGIMQIVQAMKTLSVAQVIMQALSGPKGWATLAASIALAGAAALAVNAMFDNLAESAEKAGKQSKNMTAAMKEVAAGAKKLKEGNLTFEEAKDKANEFLSKSRKWQAEATNLGKFPQHKKMAAQLKEAADKALELAKSYEKAATAQKKLGNFGAQAQGFVDSQGMFFDQYGNGASGVRSYLEKQQEAMAKFQQQQATGLRNPNVGAVSRFTSEGFSAVIQGLNNTREYHSQIEIERQQLKEQQQANERLKNIDARLEKAAERPPIILTEVSL